MRFLVVLLLGISPRLILFILALRSNYLENVFDGFWGPLMGFVFMPWTTLLCAYVWNNGTFEGWKIYALIVCIFVDFINNRSAIQKYRGEK